MLPYTPLHHLLLRELGFPVVATSGNRSEEPIATDEREALARLRGIADLFLVHDRPIARPVEDSVARVVLGREMLLRRGRGYAPYPLALPQAGQGGALLAVGAHMKSTVSLSVAGRIVTGSHLGDLDAPEGRDAHEEAARGLAALYQAAPVAIACDLHPDYASTRYAEAQRAAAGARAAPRRPRRRLHGRERLARPRARRGLGRQRLTARTAPSGAANSCCSTARAHGASRT